MATASGWTPSHSSDPEKLPHVSLNLLHHLHHGPPVCVHQGQDDLSAGYVPCFQSKSRRPWQAQLLPGRFCSLPVSLSSTSYLPCWPWKNCTSWPDNAGRGLKLGWSSPRTVSSLCLTGLLSCNPSLDTIRAMAIFLSLVVKYLHTMVDMVQ